jgi:tRNA G10  N-methylase Trm11
MTTYYFHLGRETELSLTELEAFFGRAVTKKNGIAKISHEPFENPQELFNQLGGSIKMSQEVATLEGQEIPAKFAEVLNQQKPEGKLHFGLNLFPEDNGFLDRVLKSTKKHLKPLGRNGRFLNKKGNLSSAMIVKGGLMKDLTDYNLIENGQNWVLTQTIAVQDFISYSLRDYEKPARLAKSGMLPPKLAQMMINFSGLVTGKSDFKEKTLYDPFCGSGTVLGEAAIKGMNVIGSDISPEAIQAAKTNLAWFIEKGIAPPITSQIFEHDAQTLTSKEVPNPPDIVVGESYLGPPLVKNINDDAIYNLQQELIPLYINFFKAIHPLLNEGTPLVMAFPIHHNGKEKKRLPYLIEQILPIGYKLKRSLTYHRIGQAVGREILILERS